MNIHILADSPNGVSSYANMARNLAVGLKTRGHNITITGFQTFFRPENYRGITVLPLLNPAEPDEPHLEQFRKNLDKSKAEVLICIHEGYSQWSLFAKQFPTSYIWVPVEGKGITPMMKENFDTVGAVSQSFFGQKELSSEGIDSTVIYPGWDPEIFTQNPEPHCKWSTDLHRQTGDFHALADRGCDRCEGLNEHGMCKHFEEETIIIKHCRKESTRSISSIPDIRDELGAGYVIGCVANNIGKRKNIEALIKAFSQMEYKKDALLHIHTAISTRGEPVSFLAEQAGVQDRVVVTYGEYPMSISDRAMNRIYNNFDIYSSASRAEGFGIAQLESMAVGIPQVAPAFGAFPELLGENERGLLVQVDKAVPAPNGTLWCEINTESLADKMDALFISPWLRSRMGKAAAEWAKEYTWNKVVGQWDMLLGNIGNKEKIPVAVEA